nr:hypothetical protein [uncultured Megasphaera sp.]
MSETPEGSKIAEIIINTTAKRLQQTFSYIVPDHLDVRIGSRVLVPFGHAAKRASSSPCASISTRRRPLN